MGWLSLFKREPKAPEREVFLYNGEGPGSERVGSPVEINGRKGRVVEGTVLTIVVEWEDRKHDQ